MFKKDIATYTNTNCKQSPFFRLVVDLFTCYNMQVTEIADTSLVMKLSRGHVSQSSGFVVEMFGVVCFDVFDVRKVVPDRGLRPC